MIARTDFFSKPAGLFLALVFLMPSLALADTLFVDCNARQSIGGTLPMLKPGDTILVSGTCVENVAVSGWTGQFDGITLDGQGTATISGQDSSRNTIQLTGVRNVTVKGFRITGGNDGIVSDEGESVSIENNTIEQVGRFGIQQQGGTLAVTNSVIQNNPRDGILVSENAVVRIGLPGGVGGGAGAVARPNIIQGNGGHGVQIQRASRARISANTIRNNGLNGVNVQNLSFAQIGFNVIEGNRQSGIQATQNSGVELGTDTGTGNDLPNSTRVPNGQYGIDCSLGAYADGRLGSLSGTRGPKNFTEGANDSLLP